MPGIEEEYLSGDDNLMEYLFSKGDRNGLSDGGDAKRRSSRSIKRKKFDDELVESSINLGKVGRGKIQPTVTAPTVSSGHSNKGLEVIGGASSSANPDYVRKRSSKSGKRPKRLRQLSNMLVYSGELGRWKPSDDLALITAAQQTCDLTFIHTHVKFSCHFTLSEIMDRWHSLLYKENISRVALSAISNLHRDTRSRILADTPLSQEEEEAVKNIPSTSNPTIETFQQLYENKPGVFHTFHNSKILMSYWSSLKQFHLLPDQTVTVVGAQTDTFQSFRDAEYHLNQSEAFEVRDDALDRENRLSERLRKVKCRLLEEELSHWHPMVENISGATGSDMDNPTLAILKGKLVRYLMRSKEITLGRAGKHYVVDANLSLEGPACKISRRQATIQLNSLAEFYIVNHGRRPLYVDGKPIIAGEKTLLNTNSVLEIVGLQFLFLVNQEFIEVIQREAVKLNIQ